MIEPIKIQDFQNALTIIEAPHSQNDLLLKACSFIIQNNHYDYYPQALKKLHTLESTFSNNLEWNYCIGIAKVTHQQPEESIPHLLKTLSQITNTPNIYTFLTWAYLQKKLYSQAYLTSSAGINNCPTASSLEGLQYLSLILLQGHKSISFNKNGIDYQFALFTTNTQEIEASLHHLSQKFTEQDELRMIKHHLKKVNAIAEIGCLVGNHSVYFLKNLSPKKLTIVDASQTSLTHTQTNIELNQTTSSSCEVEYIHSAIGLEAGKLHFFNNEVEVTPIDQLLDQSYDFLKIDVDGMEIDALNGSKNYLLKHQPVVMIEVLHVLKNEFIAFINSINYQIIDQIDRPDYTNYLIQSKNKHI